MLDLKVAKIARDKFSLYYKKSSISVEDIGKREFGFGDFERRILNRHVSFKDAGDLKRYLETNVPASISISTAFYKYPEARPMEKKEWLGSELVFDLDSSDLHLECQTKHGKSWVCTNCLDAVKQEAFKLIEEFLVPDFGISKNDIEINFSGNRGYHLHIKDKGFFPLDSNARRQISDYITARGIELSAFFPNMQKQRQQFRGPKPDDPGWGGKFARGMISYLNHGEEALVGLGIDGPLARKMLRNKAEIILGITVGNWDKVSIPRKAEFWSNILKGMTVAQTSSIDKNVTSGAEHLIRLPNTIHSDTALLAKRIKTADDLGAFDPMKEAVLFKKGALDVYVEKANELFMDGTAFGPYEKQSVELPTCAALYLLLKRVAVLRA